MGSGNFPPALTQATEVAMAQADDLPNLVRIPFPDASEKTSTKPGRPAGNERGEANAPEPGGGRAERRG
jgi:hypothetical protein